ncbi:nucleoside diphosphate kinase, putative [Trypanosoma brucei gambiense DAL972]|uniref:Nucleoside diphosphate kinase, putative n=1 Tax=Trypanosoma brucei gambiense (strain MHOM/CI/86/DAL972) TaxID=679716 RepID=C9ZM33_TRYB9|nr:nucleoside diphosphate kinase, putative [Trypanosoma brucei gambiense DAL972]CBH10458.1 nucleoside diphosphate kinase, putative [Trypanosoma brucei gambiense DAL972]|eukprot:XP_011772748.1 nucleoside diphosphate kinase, putative [Trypanosoma brucei gambiense DAL972]
MARSLQDPRLSFYCEQYDHIAHRMNHYVLQFYFEDRTVEIREVTKNRLHLKRAHFPHLNRDDFKVGSSLSLLGGVIKLTAYADEVTRELCDERGEVTAVMFGEQLLPQLGRCLAVLTEECGFVALEMQMAWLPVETAAAYGVPPDLVEGRIVVVKCANTNALQRGIDFMARMPGARAAESVEEVGRWEQIVEKAKEQPVAILGDPNSTVVIIKPHALQKLAGGVIVQQLIDAGLEISGISLTNMTSQQANELLKPYKGVLPDFPDTMRSLMGTVWVLQFVSLDEGVDVVSVAREVCGPFDPVIAKELRPTSIRARFGVDRAHNAVHCCDLHEEGPLYSNFFFRPEDVDE